jgi:hypothetical protein
MIILALLDREQSTFFFGEPLVHLGGAASGQGAAPLVASGLFLAFRVPRIGWLFHRQRPQSLMINLNLHCWQHQSLCERLIN